MGSEVDVSDVINCTSKARQISAYKWYEQQKHSKMDAITSGKLLLSNFICDLLGTGSEAEKAVKRQIQDNVLPPPGQYTLHFKLFISFLVSLIVVLCAVQIVNVCKRQNMAWVMCWFLSTVLIFFVDLLLIETGSLFVIRVGSTLVLAYPL